jgi:hypothetical protein
MWHVPRLLLLFFFFSFFQNQASKPIPAVPIFISPHFLPKPIFFLPPSHGFSPTSTGVTPLLFLLSVCIEMEAKNTQIQRTQAPKTHLCARSAKRWKERVEWRFWMPATAPPPLVSLSSVLRYRSRASPLSSSPTVSSIILSPVQHSN